MEGRDFLFLLFFVDSVHTYIQRSVHGGPNMIDEQIFLKIPETQKATEKVPFTTQKALSKKKLRE
jgi:hypothetical protein